MSDPLPDLDINLLSLTIASRIEQLSTPIWIYGFDHHAILWANPAGLAFWRADSIAELASRSGGEPESPHITERLQQHLDDLRRNPLQSRTEAWTLYPKGEPRSVECTFHWCPLPDGSPAALVEAHLQAELSSDLMRCVDALMQSQVMTGLYDETGQELFANRALREAMGPGTQRFGETFINPNARYDFLSGMTRSGTHHATVEVKTPKGRRWLDMQAARCSDAATGQCAFQISASDVTAMYKQEMTLRAARDEALSADRAKSEFVATMSHEMRTPLNGILGMVELLSFTGLDDRQSAQIQIIRDSGKALLALIEDVLDLSSLEIRAITPVREPFDLYELVDAVASGLRLPAAEKGLELRDRIARDVPRQGIGDARRLAQLMRNLMANAIKFTTRGSIELIVEREGMSTLKVEVIDTGPGVPEAQQDKIFQKFHQLDQSRSVHDGGVGLGLAICKELVNLFGGKIGVNNISTGGARFWFTIPDVLANSHYIHAEASRGQDPAA